MTRITSTAYHLLDARNWASVQLHGLLSAQRLMERSGDIAGDALRRHRQTGQRLSCGPYIRDQRPMPPATLSSCLREGLQPDDWFALLNSKVFFWLAPERLNRQRRRGTNGAGRRCAAPAGELFGDGDGEPNRQR